MTAIKAEDHIGLVHVIAQNWSKRSGYDFEELRQEGFVGLMTAVKKFDPTFEVPFATYAFWWVSACVSRHLRDKSRTIRLPARTKTREKLKAIGELPRVAKSLDKRIYFDNDMTTLHDKLSDDAEPVDDAASAGELAEKIWAVMARFPEQTQKVMKMIYVDGLTGVQVGSKIGVSRQRVDQIHQKALNDLKPLLKVFT